MDKLKKRHNAFANSAILDLVYGRTEFQIYDFYEFERNFDYFKDEAMKEKLKIMQHGVRKANDTLKRNE